MFNIHFPLFINVLSLNHAGHTIIKSDQVLKKFKHLTLFSVSIIQKLMINSDLKKTFAFHLIIRRKILNSVSNEQELQFPPKESTRDTTFG